MGESRIRVPYQRGPSCIPSRISVAKCELSRIQSCMGGRVKLIDYSALGNFLLIASRIPSCIVSCISIVAGGLSHMLGKLRTTITIG